MRWVATSLHIPGFRLAVRSNRVILLADVGRKEMSKSRKVSRRKVLAGAAGVLGSAVLASKSAAQTTAASDPTKVQGHLASEIGQRSAHEQLQRIPFRSTRTSSHTPLQDLEGIITPSDLHFERHHAGIPEIDPENYSLLIHGMVERPTVYTLANVKRFPPGVECDSHPPFSSMCEYICPRNSAELPADTRPYGSATCR